jgi:hypothetical protein
MFARLKNVKEYKGEAPLLSTKEIDDLLKWTHGTTYAAVSNNGFLDVYMDSGKLKFDSNHAKALVKCDAGALMMYKGEEALRENARIFEEELERLENELIQLKMGSNE